MQRIELSWSDVNQLSRIVHDVIISQFGASPNSPIRIFGIPNGGIPAALSVAGHSSNLIQVEDPKKAEVLVDDLIDSGNTKTKWTFQFPNIPFHVLVDKKLRGWKGVWVSFPWERMKQEQGPEDNIVRILEFIGEDPKREGLLETPKRVIKSYSEIFGGYSKNPEEVLKTFEDDSCDEMVILRDIEFYSVCEHHMQPFFGRAHISYIPNGRVVGISKLARLLEVFSRRLQIQERLTEQITGALMEHLAPKGAACVLEAQHFCMVCRGVGKQNSKMITSSLKGAFLEPAVRAEFLSMIRG